MKPCSHIEEVNLELQTYFDNKKGLGVLATADSNGKVNAAVYSRPHFLEDGTIAYIMRDRLTHLNIQSNPQAAYLFVEDGPGYQGRRLYLKKIREEEGGELLQSLRRRSDKKDEEETRFLVVFEIEEVLPLIGASV